MDNSSDSGVYSERSETHFQAKQHAAYNIPVLRDDSVWIDDPSQSLDSDLVR